MSLIGRVWNYVVTEGVISFIIESMRHIGKNIQISATKIKYITYRNKYEIHDDFYFNGPQISLYGNGDIILGEGSYIGRNSRIKSVSGACVKIGKNCPISHYVAIYTKNRVADQDITSETIANSVGDVIIEDNVWIGYRVYITEGVSIGQNSVIGANSVVTRDLPPHCIAAGSPAKVIKFKSYLDESKIRELKKEYTDVLSKTL